MEGGELLPTILFKPGVYLKFIDYRFLWLAKVVWEAYQRRNLIPTCTSACDSRHSQNSLHYEGLAWDWRIWGVNLVQTPQDEVRELADEIKEEARKLSSRYDIVYGDAKHLDHIHSEWDERKEVG